MDTPSQHQCSPAHHQQPANHLSAGTSAPPAAPRPPSPWPPELHHIIQGLNYRAGTSRPTGIFTGSHYPQIHLQSDSLSVWTRWKRSDPTDLQEKALVSTSSSPSLPSLACHQLVLLLSIREKGGRRERPSGNTGLRQQGALAAPRPYIRGSPGFASMLKLTAAASGVAHLCFPPAVRPLVPPLTSDDDLDLVKCCYVDVAGGVM